MRYTIISGSNDADLWMLVFDKGERALEALLTFAEERKIAAGSFSGLGAFSEATLAFFDRTTKEYAPIPVEEQTEVLNITGNIALHEGRPRLHAHATLGKPDGSTIGGHLVEGIVWPTLEITLIATAGKLERVMDEETGLPLLKP